MLDKLILITVKDNDIPLSIEKGVLTRHSEVRISGSFTGCYEGVVRVNLITSAGQIVLRIALRLRLLNITNISFFKIYNRVDLCSIVVNELIDNY